ncbi:response regulator [Trinickia fusca]|uniref:Response regulator n=1 Tax=Trinickia fusca TaxID=2419777 RepID=A0A494X7Z6_9BURK|nr:response regulator [Trinickia fusca]
MKTDWHGKEPRPTAVKATQRAVAHSAVRKQVLVADPDDEALTELVNLLDSLGYETIAVHSVEQALEFAQQHLPDAVLVEIAAQQLEGLEGLDAARPLRELAGGSPLLLIALTGWGQPQYRQMALAAGFDVHLVKPIGVDQLSFLLSMTLV